LALHELTQELGEGEDQLAHGALHVLGTGVPAGGRGGARAPRDLGPQRGQVPLPEGHDTPASGFPGWGANAYAAHGPLSVTRTSASWHAALLKARRYAAIWPRSPRW